MWPQTFDGCGSYPDEEKARENVKCRGGEIKGRHKRNANFPHFLPDSLSPLSVHHFFIIMMFICHVASRVMFAYSYF